MSANQPYTAFSGPGSAENILNEDAKPAAPATTLQPSLSQGKRQSAFQGRSRQNSQIRFKVEPPAERVGPNNNNNAESKSKYFKDIPISTPARESTNSTTLPALPQKDSTDLMPKFIPNPKFRKSQLRNETLDSDDDQDERNSAEGSCNDSDSMSDTNRQRRDSQQSATFNSPTKTTDTASLINKHVLATSNMRSKQLNRSRSSSVTSGQYPNIHDRVVSTDPTQGRRLSVSQPLNSLRANYRRRASSVSSEIKRLHPLVKWYRERLNAFLQHPWTRKALAIMGEQRTEIIVWVTIMMMCHAAITTLLVLSLSMIMPAIWVYNFVQLYVIFFCIFSNYAGYRISKVVKISIAASDLIRGNIKLDEISDFWVNGKRGPAYRISHASTIVEFLAEFIIVICSILYSWEAVPTRILHGTCNPPYYPNGTALRSTVQTDQFLQGDIDFATIYNYGLPLQDGLIGAWAGWPLDIVADAFTIKNTGPVYVLQVLCDNGVERPDLTLDVPTLMNGRLIASDGTSLMYEITIQVPPGTMINDLTGKTNDDHVYEQHCTSVVAIGVGKIEYGFVMDEWDMVTGGRLIMVESISNETGPVYKTEMRLSTERYAYEALQAFHKNMEDPYGVMPVVSDAVAAIMNNGTYFPSQGASFCNMLSWGTLPDGFYHSDIMNKGVSAALGAAIHYGLMQYDGSHTISCEYFGYQGSGILLIPELAVIAAAIGSGVAIFIKIFEILWWALTAAPQNSQGYRKAVRALKHPLRFAFETAEMLSEFVKDPERDVDLCDATLNHMITSFGSSRIQFGEDIRTADEPYGHLMINKVGKVTVIHQERRFGSLAPPTNPELEQLMEY